MPCKFSGEVVFDVSVFVSVALIVLVAAVVVSGVIAEAADNASCNFKTSQYLDAAFQHGREVIGDTRKEYLAVDVADDRHLDTRTREHFFSVGCLRETEEEHDASHDQDQNERSRHGVERTPDAAAHARTRRASHDVGN